MDNEPILINNWKELKEQTSENYILEIDLEYGSGWIHPKDIDPSTEHSRRSYYLSTHTFYNMSHEHETKKLQACGFNVKLANWDAKRVQK